MVQSISDIINCASGKRVFSFKNKNKINIHEGSFAPYFVLLDE